MKQEDLLLQIAELEKEIAALPEGSVTKKKVNGKDYYYHRINRNGKRTEKYVSFVEVDELSSRIERRKELDKRLKELNKLVVNEKVLKSDQNQSLVFNSMVRIGRSLKAQIEPVKKYKKRECIKELRDYVFGGVQDKVFVIYGLRRTGKTTMIRQILTELTETQFNKAAFIQARAKDTLADIDSDLRLLEENGYKYVFIDEVTLLEDFIEGAAVFSDIYASSGMKIILSGTDSLGFAFSKEEQLYDRCVLLHTTFIPYREFEEVLGIKGIDEYIRYGGTMSLGGINYNTEGTFAGIDSTEAYIDTAIAKNIQHSLKMYQYGGHFRGLLDLYEKNELTNVINRVVENINHSFARSVVERTFKSTDLSITANNLLKDRENPINIKEHMDLDDVTAGIKQMLEILNKEEQSVDISDTHMLQIKEYLTLLDLVEEIDVEYLPDVDAKGKLTVITQPGMRYAQAGTIVENLLMDAKFKELSAEERKRILVRLLNEIRGRMMEDIVLLETKIANPKKDVFKLQFPVGEFDMVIADRDALTCEIYEVKYSKEQVPEQYRHINDEEKCKMTAHRFGEITKRCVIYIGETTKENSIEYMNVEEYLSKPQSE